MTVWPGRTLGVLYCASYESPSVLPYHELILAPALVATGGRIGFWISHIFVDDPASQAGGRAIWGLPKALASFAWEPEGSEVSVSTGAQLLCHIRLRRRAPSVPVPMYLPAFGRDAGRFLFFTGRGSASVACAAGEIRIPTGSPLESCGFEDSRRLLIARHLRLRVGPPRPRA